MPRAIIVGGGIAGLASGIAFAKAGWDVTVLERARSIESMGAALSLWPNACAAMASLGILGAVTAAAEGWPLPISDAISVTPPDALIPFVVHAKQPPKTLCAPGIIRVGDAAHAMEPNLGQGACQGLEDAAALQAIAAAVAPAQVAALYERLRLKRVRMFVWESALGRLGVHGPRPVQYLMRATLRAMHTMPDYAARVA